MRNTERFLIGTSCMVWQGINNSNPRETILQARTKGRPFVQCSCPAMLPLSSFTGDILEHVCATSNSLTMLLLDWECPLFRMLSFLTVSVWREELQFIAQKILLLNRKVNKARHILLGKSLLFVWFLVFNCQRLRSKILLVSFST